MSDTQTQLQSVSLSSERSLYASPDWTAVGTGSNATVTATAVAVAGKVNHCTKLVASFSAAPAAACTVTIKDGTTVIFQAEIPAAVTAPIPFDFSQPGTRLRGSTGNALVAGCTTPGASTICTLTMEGLTTWPT